MKRILLLVVSLPVFIPVVIIGYEVVREPGVQEKSTPITLASRHINGFDCGHLFVRVFGGRSTKNANCIVTS